MGFHMQVDKKQWQLGWVSIWKLVCIRNLDGFPYGSGTNWRLPDAYFQLSCKSEDQLHTKVKTPPAPSIMNNPNAAFFC